MGILSSTAIYTGHEADIEAVGALNDAPDPEAPEQNPSFDASVAAFWERCHIDVSNW